MKHLQRVAVGLVLALVAVFGSGCTTAIVVMHAYDKITEGDPAPCRHLNSVERALQPRCGAFVPGSLAARDTVASGLPVCPLTLAARDPRLWPVLPELLQKGAQPEHCAGSPFVALAQAQPCPDFAAASPAVLQSLRWLAEADARAVQHDAVRALSCPNARSAGLDRVLDTWLAHGQLPAAGLPFGVLAALHPSHLVSAFSQALETQGHRPTVGIYQGQQPSGFEEALRAGDLAALDWWLTRAPALANQAPASRSNQLPWRPLARVLTPNFMSDAAQRQAVVQALLARGADPWKPLPHEPGQTVVGYARQLRSPLLALLDPPPPPAPAVIPVSGQAFAAVPAAPAR